jgi:predicted dinucleotide-binding enzyme
MKVGFIGAGHIGGNLARLAAKAGHEVLVSNSRNPKTLFTLLGQIGDKAKGGSPKDAALFGDIVVIAIPFSSHLEMSVEELKGKVVIDANNHFPARDGNYPEIDSGKVTSAELLARHLYGAKVVRTFSSVTSGDLLTDARPMGSPERRAIPLAGDDAAAKRVVAGFVSELGFDTLDVGGLSQGRKFEVDSKVFGAKLNLAALKAALL